MESLHRRIIAAASRVTLELPRAQVPGFLGFRYDDWEAPAAQLRPGNKRIYAEALPQTVAVSNEIARYFALRVSVCNEAEEKIWSATTRKQIWEAVKYMPNFILSVYQMNVVRGYDALKSAAQFWKIHYDRLDDIAKLWSNLDLALWAYRLEPDREGFILRRGE